MNIAASILILFGYYFAFIVMLVIITQIFFEIPCFILKEIIVPISKIDPFITSKIEDVIKAFCHVILVLTFIFPIIPITVHEYIQTRDRPVDVVPLTYEEQKEMGQLHHCKFYQEQ
jgi:hypothetical protein